MIKIKLKHISNQQNTIKRIIVEILLAIMKALAFLKKVLAVFLFWLFRPLAFFFRFVFFKILVKISIGYFSFVKKIGLDKFRQRLIPFLLSRRTAHIIFFLLLFFTAASNLAAKNNLIKPFIERARETVISKLVANEFSADYSDDQLIEETGLIGRASLSAQFKYLNSGGKVENLLSIFAGLPAEKELSLADLAAGAGEVLMKPELATTKKSKKTRKEALEYIVQPGDTISTLAVNFDISVNTILWENSLSAYSLIRPGDKLIILPATGVNHKIAKGETLGAIAAKYSVEAEEILQANGLADDAKLALGQKIFIPGGHKYFYVPPAAAAPSYNPIAVIKDLVKPSAAASIPANKMVWPTAGHIITQYFSWRHTGLDIANKKGTPLYAADSGTVTFSGWSTGYGNRIDIDHGGGKKTRYGHASELYVKKGDVVKKGDAIAAMGSTGRSTGPHLHFEVFIDGKRYNPLSYIK